MGGCRVLTNRLCAKLAGSASHFISYAAGCKADFFWHEGVDIPVEKKVTPSFLA